MSKRKIAEGIFDRIIDRIYGKIAKKDPKVARLRKRSDRLQREIEDMLIDMFGSLDKVPDGYKKQFNIK